MQAVLIGHGYIGEPLILEMIARGWQIFVISRRNNKELRVIKDRLITVSQGYNRLSFFSADTTTRLIALSSNLISKFSNQTEIFVLNAGIPAPSNSQINMEQWVDGVLEFVACIKSRFPHTIFVNIGSIAEYAAYRGRDYSYYKKLSRRRMFSSSVCDFHILFGFVYGQNKRMRDDLNMAHWVLKRSGHLLSKVLLPCINREALIKKFIGFLAISNKIHRMDQKTVEIWILGEDLTLQELMLRTSILIYEKENGHGELAGKIKAHFACMIILFLSKLNIRFSRFSRFCNCLKSDKYIDGNALCHYKKFLKQNILGKGREIHKFQSSVVNKYNDIWYII